MNRLLSVLLSVTLLLQVTVTVVSGQGQDATQGQCKCVPYYLCINGTIVTSGKGIIDERSGGLKCDGFLVKCCYKSMKSKASKDMDLTTQDIDKTILGEMSTPIPQTMPSDTCKCVPYYLCENGTIVTSGKGIIDERSGGLKCDGFLVKCCYKSMKSKPTEIPDPVHRAICGHWNPHGVKPTITGGSHNEAQFGEFPWMMAILKLEANQSKTYLCGGSLIHPKAVLTAAHCVNRKSPNELVIRAGEWDTQTENEPLPSQDGQALKIINHADFEPDELLNDVALIIVIDPFSLSENVGTICLPSPNYVFAKNRCYGSGWGKKEFGKLGVNQVIMKKIDLPIVPRSSCLELLRETRLGVDYILPESFICAGGEIGKDTCQGDGGSPLMCPIENRPKQFQQVGIVSWGIGCGNKTPGVYVDVALFRNWIDEQMAKEKLSTIYYDPDYVPTN